jgi:hypothetical protein
VKYAWIGERRDSFPVALMCQVLGVSKSGYYASINREPSERARRHERIKAAVAQVHADSHGIYGSPKIAQALLEREDLVSASETRVRAAEAPSD